MRPGDVYVLNAPYNGGTHLPDITVIMPVFAEDDAEPKRDVLFYVAARGHHADIGGITPGSMPPDSRTVEEEGVLIDNFLLVDGGRFRERGDASRCSPPGAIRRATRRRTSPISRRRSPPARRASQELHRMVRHFGAASVEAYMRHVQDNAEEAVRRVLDVLKDGAFAYEMDDGAVIQVRIAIDQAARRADDRLHRHQRAAADTISTRPPRSASAAVLYVFRTLVDDDIPMNDGCLKPLDIIIPEGSMLNPRYPAAVVAGNVETCKASPMRSMARSASWRRRRAR